MVEAVGLPAGFVLDDGAAGAPVGLPEGFEIDGADANGAVATGIKGVAQGMTGNFADELDAFLTSKGLNPFSAKVSYDEKLAANRGQDNADTAANPVSNMTGQVTGTVLDMVGLTKAFPALAKVFTNVTAKGVLPSVAASSGAGAVSGAIYGAGDGEGDAQSRVSSAVDSGLAGGLFGTVGAVAARPAGYLTERALKLVRKASKPAAPVAKGITRSPVTAVQPAQGSVIPLTKGQATQDPALQSLENMGRSGAIDDAAQSAVLKADYAQQDAIKGAVDRIAGGEVAEEGLAKAGGLLKDGYKGLKADVSKAYDDASVIRSVYVDKKPLAQSFAPRVKDIMYKQGFDASNITPESKKLLDQLDSLNDDKVTGLNLEKLEFWRRKISNRAEQLKGDPEGVMLSRVRESYDDLMSKLPEGALKAGDDKALQSILDARSLRKRQGVLFERNKVVSNIVKNDELTNEELANLVLTGSARSQNINAGSGQSIRAMKRAAGDKAPELVQNMAKGTMARILNKSMTNTQRAGTDVQMISPPKLLKELDGLMGNKTFMNEVFDESARNTILALRNDLKKVASEQPGSRNYSNTAYTVMQYLRKLPLGLSSVAGIAEIGLKPIAERGARNELNKSLQSMVGEVQSELVGQARIYGAAAAGGQAPKINKNRSE